MVKLKEHEGKLTKIHKISTNENVADIFTKPLHRKPFEYHSVFFIVYYLSQFNSDTPHDLISLCSCALVRIKTPRAHFVDAAKHNIVVVLLRRGREVMNLDVSHLTCPAFEPSLFNNIAR